VIELFLYIAAGIFLGIFSGLMPGIHLNTISFFVAAFALQGDFNLAVLVVSMSVTHSFIDFIPSILLGASDNESDFLSTLPGHRMFLKGKALEAVKLSAFGCLLGAILAIAFSPVFVSFALQIAEFLPKILLFLLAFVLLLMVFSEKGFWKKVFAVIVIFLAGILGIASLNASGMQNSLLALVSGFFAVPSLLWSLKQKAVFVKQEDSEAGFEKKPALLSGFFGSIAGSIVALLPSIGPSEAALMIRKLVGEISEKAYLVLLGSISTANMVFSFFMLYYFSKTRTGSAVALKQIIQLSQNQFFLLIAIVLFTAGIAFFLSTWLSRKAVFFLQKMNYSLLNIAVFVFLSLMVFAFSGFLGLLVFFTASSIGIFSLSIGVKRSHSMAFLMLPTMIFYFNALINSL
jgi:putative membrane protein